MTHTSLPAGTSSNAPVNLPSPSRIRKLKRSAGSPRSISRLRLLGSPGSGRVGGDAQDVDPAGLDLQHEEYVQRLRNTVSTCRNRTTGVRKPGRSGTAARSVRPRGARG